MGGTGRQAGTVRGSGNPVLRKCCSRIARQVVILAAVAVSFAGEPLAGQAGAADGADRWNKQWKQRADVRIPPGSQQLLRVQLPAELKQAEIRCILDGRAEPLGHWVQQMEMAEPVRVAESRKVHYGFPRIVRTAGGDLLLFYRVGTTHASDDAQIAVRRSKDGGKTWLDETVLWQPPSGRGAHNPVALGTPTGRVILWASDYKYSARPPARLPGVWSQSLDDGQTWSRFTTFDKASTHSTYYITEAIPTTDGLLAAAATFPPSGVGKCHTPIWHSADDGRTWSVRSELTGLDENKGNEVALLETEPDTILCLLRDRQMHDTYRYWSRDGGRTWTRRESIGRMLDCVLQRPFLTRIDAKTVLLSGRDFRRKLVVAYISRNNGRSFGDRHVIDSFQRDGGYTAALRTGASEVLIVWYSDSGTTPLKPDIKSARLSFPTRQRYLWIRLPTQTTTEGPQRLFIYYGNAKAQRAEDRTLAWLRPTAWTDAAMDCSEP